MIKKKNLKGNEPYNHCVPDPNIQGGATSVYLNGCSMVVKRLPSRGNLETGLGGLGPGGTVG